MFQRPRLRPRPQPGKWIGRSDWRCSPGTTGRTVPFVDTDFTAVPDWFPTQNAGAGIAVGDVNGDGHQDVVVLMVDDAAEQNAGYFRVGWGTDDQATVGSWTAWTAVPDWFPWFND